MEGKAKMPLVCSWMRPCMQYAGRCNKVFNEHTDTIKALAVIGDGQLASGGVDRCIKIWVCADYCILLDVVYLVSLELWTCPVCNHPCNLHLQSDLSFGGHVAFAVFVLWFGGVISWVF